MPREIILFVPGVSGCYLRDRQTGALTWGRPIYLLAWCNYDRSRLPWMPEQEDLATFGPVLDRIWFSRRLRLSIPFYDHLFRPMREQFGQRQGDIEHPTPDATFYPWAYDWRKSLVDLAQQLDETVERLIDFHQDPDLKVTLICHSSGGLGARWWWAHGARDIPDTDDPPPPDFPRRRNLGRLISVGVPHLGTLKLLHDLTHGIQVVRFGRLYRPDFLFSMPCLYEALPFDATDRFVGPDGDPLPIDLSDPQDWFRWRLGLFTRRPDLLDDASVRAFFERTLPRARRFQRTLAQPWPDDMIDRVHIIGSDTFQTIRRVPVGPEGIDIRHTAAIMKRGQWRDETEDQWVERGDWFASTESLTGLAHRPEHFHRAQCIHRELFTDPAVQAALAQTLTGD